MADPNYVFKMVEAIQDDSPNGRRVLELGPGTGALTSRLHVRYPEMFSIELDQRAMRVLAEKVPGVTCIRSDVLLVNFTQLAEIRGGPLTITSTLPYGTTSNVLFKLLDHANAVGTVTTTMQKELADRFCARPGGKKYGIPSVIFQLYADCRRLFDIPPTAMFPRPNVMSTFVEFDFGAAKERRETMGVDPRDLKNLTKMAFRQRNKKLQNSLRELVNCHTTLLDELPLEYAHQRAAFLEPWEYVYLTQLMFGKKEFPKKLRYSWRSEFGKRNVPYDQYDD
jgi:16S rRNA (adenine1518-N6/adenine1519-N6)-dimethyltransferase